jgi:hypothetical protein
VHPSIFQVWRLRAIDLTCLDRNFDEFVSSAQDGLLPPDAIRNRPAHIVAELQANSLPASPVLIPASEM